MPRLGVNIDHVATVRQARKQGVPDLLSAARAAIDAGADGITAHLREDRRHIQDDDMHRLKKELSVPLNMEMSIAPEILQIALNVKPDWACLVPEKREELTTEGGLDVNAKFDEVARVVARLKQNGTRVSLFVQPDVETMRLSKKAGADAVELHTGHYARVFRVESDRNAELARIKAAALEAESLGLTVNAGHGIDYENGATLLSAYAFHEFNIGFSIIARSLFVGLPAAVREMKTLMSKGRSN
jgi:pyridoxine 5-phosphate synthase